MKDLTRGSGEQKEKALSTDEEALKKAAPEPKAPAPKKRKLEEIPSAEPKVDEAPEKTLSPSLPSTVEVSEILKVMTESPPFKLLSPLGFELTNLLQKKKMPSVTEEKVGGKRKQRIMNVIQAIEQTPPSASLVKAAIPVNAESAGGAEAKEFVATMSEIDKLISDVVEEKPDVVVEKSMAAVPDKGKKIYDAPSEEKDFDLRHLGGQELSEEDKLELKEFAMSCGYQLGSILFGGVDEKILGCIHDRAGAKIVGTLSKSVGFLKLETDISCYRRQHIIGSLFYSNFKVRFFSKLLNITFVAV
jgi:hypothetical protein